jgi:hypothetical protein
MKLARLLLIASVLLALVPAASAAPEAASGGALALPPQQAEGGGALAPEHYGAPAASESSSAGGAAAAEAAREEPPIRQTEPPEPERAPYPGVSQQTVGEAVGDAAEVQTAAGRAPDRAKRMPAVGNPAAGSSLPWTGLEIGAIAAIGLGFLTLGIALRPRRVTRR